MKPALAFGVLAASLAAGGLALALGLRRREPAGQATPEPVPPAAAAPTAPPAPTVPTADQAQAIQAQVLQTCLTAIDTLDPTEIALAGNAIVTTAPQTAELMGRIALEVQEVQESEGDYDRHEQAKEKLAITVGDLRDLAANKLTGVPRQLTEAIAAKLDTLANQ